MVTPIQHSFSELWSASDVIVLTLVMGHGPQPTRAQPGMQGDLGRVLGEDTCLLFQVCVGMYVCALSHVQLFATPSTVARQAPLSMGFPRQECGSGLPFPSPGDLPDPGIELAGSPGEGNGNPLPYSYLGNPMVSAPRLILRLNLLSNHIIVSLSEKFQLNVFCLPDPLLFSH